MKTLKITIITLVAFFLASIMGCKKGNSPTPKVASSNAQVTFQMKAVNGSNLAGGTADTIAGLIWTAGTAHISRFMFDAMRGGANIEVESDSVPPVNLFSLALSSIPTYVTLDTGIYKEIGVSVFLKHTSDTSAIPLKLTGTFKNDSSKNIPIELDLNSNVTIKVEMNNIDINGKTDYMVLVQMGLDKVTSGITANNLNHATVTGGKIVISQTSNYPLYDKIVDNLSRCGESEWRERDHGDHDDHDWH